jgi:hypothetical protein
MDADKAARHHTTSWPRMLADQDQLTDRELVTMLDSQDTILPRTMCPIPEIDGLQTTLRQTMRMAGPQETMRRITEMDELRQVLRTPTDDVRQVATQTAAPSGLPSGRTAWAAPRRRASADRAGRRCGRGCGEPTMS